MIELSHWPFIRIFSRWFAAANNAIEGILHAAKTQRHLKFHLLAAFSVLLGCFVIGLDKVEFAIIALITVLVIVAEMFNSALEAVVDLATQEFGTLARTAKDISAGAVLISAIGALVIGYLILGPHLAKIWLGFYHVPRHTAGYPDQVLLRGKSSAARRVSQRPFRFSLFTLDFSYPCDRQPLVNGHGVAGSDLHCGQPAAFENSYFSRCFLWRVTGLSHYPDSVQSFFR
jgi:diacylglycerol kinase